MGDIRSLQETAHLRPGPRTGHYVHPLTGGPGPSPGNSPVPIHLPVTCPLLRALQACGLSAAAWTPRRDRPGPTRPDWVHYSLPIQVPSPHTAPRLPPPPLLRSRAPRSKSNQLKGKQTHRLLLPPFGPLSPESPVLSLAYVASLLSPTPASFPHAPRANLWPPDPTLPLSPRAEVASPRPAQRVKRRMREPGPAAP